MLYIALIVPTTQHMRYGRSRSSRHEVKGEVIGRHYFVGTADWYPEVVKLADALDSKSFKFSRQHNI